MTSPILDDLPSAWRDAIVGAVPPAALAALDAFLAAEDAAGATIFPPARDRFTALALTPPEAVRVVILGQDPYHGPGQAHGLAFSVAAGVRVPPSLANIHRELASDLGITKPVSGSLTGWAKQGVLLLNTTLTVRSGEAASHAGRGWDAVTQAILRAVDAGPHPVAFLLWGSHAQKAAAFVDTSRHLVLPAPHPSPLSAHRGFLGCGHFSRANAFLADHGRGTIDWAATG
ncbi:uracil-DNA glycosylase [Sphingomonas donggukensis]|uniref:Uracil-DNA glycosylase n=1 Tax=Sphingomonas donggukensis TaxID=2949093 RepID=A0ABY4TYY5_9SPHN|nr:uracil-DNA glycosylase [Sphingomonas donggukensis]URW75523.1 uracil-DNA glycosylase [Sphingomonas donggukensis]